MRVIENKQFKEVEDTIKEFVGWYDIWTISKVIEYVERYGSDKNTLREDVETAYNIIKEKSFANDYFEDDNNE